MALSVVLFAEEVEGFGRGVGGRGDVAMDLSAASISHVTLAMIDSARTRG